MGNASSLHAEATTVVSAGADTHHACFMLGLKMDLYQPKYANLPATYNVTACPPGSALLEGKYGVGTVFSGFNDMGQQEILSIAECSFTSGGTGLVVFNCAGILVTHTTTALPNGDCQFTLAMDGPNMGMFTNHIAMQLNTMKAFIEANVVAICADAPPAGRAVVVAAAVAAPAAGVIVATIANTGFVEVPQHAQSQQAAQNMMPQSQNMQNGNQADFGG
jgi:hypothetical protein